MQEAEKKRFHGMYDLQIESLRKAYQDLRPTPVNNSRAVVDRRCLNSIGFKIGDQAYQILMMHKAGILRGINLEDCMETTFGLLGWFIWIVHGAMSNAGPTLASNIYESMADLNDCTLELLKCTILYGPFRSPNDWRRLPVLVENVMDVCRSLIHSPKTNAAAIAVALVQVAGDIKGAFLEMQEMQEQDKGRRSSGRSNKRGASTRNSDGREERIVAGMAIGVLPATVGMIEELANVILKWDDNDNHISGTAMLMEDLLRISNSMRDHIFEIECSIFPLQVVSVHGALEGMEYSVNSMNNKLGPSGCCMEELFLKLGILRISIEKAKSRLLNLMAKKAAVGDLAYRFQGIGLSH